MPVQEQFVDLPSSGGTDAVQGPAYQANERDSERHQSPEAVRLGELVQRQSSGYSAEGAQCASQDSLPGSAVHHGLDQRPLPGKLCPHNLNWLWNEQQIDCIKSKKKQTIFLGLAITNERRWKNL